MEKKITLAGNVRHKIWHNHSHTPIFQCRFWKQQHCSLRQPSALVNLQLTGEMRSAIPVLSAIPKKQFQENVVPRVFLHGYLMCLSLYIMCIRTQKRKTFYRCYTIIFFKKSSPMNFKTIPTLLLLC